MRSKGESRREFGARRDALTPAQVKDRSRAIREQLLTAPLVAEAGVVLAYASKGNEVETLHLIRSLLD